MKLKVNITDAAASLQSTTSKMQTTSNKTNMLNLERQLKSADTYVLNNNNKNKNTQRQKKKLVKHKTVTIHAHAHTCETLASVARWLDTQYAQIYSSV